MATVVPMAGGTKADKEEAVEDASIDSPTANAAGKGDIQHDHSSWVVHADAAIASARRRKARFSLAVYSIYLVITFVVLAQQANIDGVFYARKQAWEIMIGDVDDPANDWANVRNTDTFWTYMTACMASIASVKQDENFLPQVSDVVLMTGRGVTEDCSSEVTDERFSECIEYSTLGNPIIDSSSFQGKQSGTIYASGPPNSTMADIGSWSSRAFARDSMNYFYRVLDAEDYTSELTQLQQDEFLDPNVAVFANIYTVFYVKESKRLLMMDVGFTRKPGFLKAEPPLIIDFPLVSYSEREDYVRLAFEIIALLATVLMLSSEVLDISRKVHKRRVQMGMTTAKAIRSGIAKYFRDPWNTIDWTCHALFVMSAISWFVFTQLSFHGDQIGKGSLDLTTAIPFQFLQVTWTIQLYKISAGLFMIAASIRATKFMQNHDEYNFLTATVAKCWNVLSRFLALFFCALLLFAGFANITYGSQLETYGDYFTSFVACFRFFFGDFDYQEMAEADPTAADGFPLLAPIYFTFFGIFMVLVMSNVAVTILLGAYESVLEFSQEQRNIVKNYTTRHGPVSLVDDGYVLYKRTISLFSTVSEKYPSTRDIVKAFKRHKRESPNSSFMTLSDLRKSGFGEKQANFILKYYGFPQVDNPEPSPDTMVTSMKRIDPAPVMEQLEILQRQSVEQMRLLETLHQRISALEEQKSK